MAKNTRQEILKKEAKGLPPLPKGEREVRWTRVCAEPGFWYDGEEYVVDEAFVSQQVAEYKRYTEGGYTAPVEDNHIEQGKRFGDVLELQRWVSPEGRLHIIAATMFTDEINKMIDTGHIKYMSPSFKEITDERNRHFPFVLTGHSFVAAPHQKSLGEVHILNSESGGRKMDPETIPEGAAPPQLSEETIASLSELGNIAPALVEMAEGFAAFKAKKGEDEDDDSEMGEDEEEDDAKMGEVPEAIAVAMREQKKTIDALQAQLLNDRLRKRFETCFKPGNSVTMSEGNREAAFKLYSTDPATYTALFGNATAAKPEPPKDPLAAYPQWTAVTMGEDSSENVTQDDFALAAANAKLSGNSQEVELANILIARGE